MLDLSLQPRTMRVLMGLFLAAAMLALLVPRQLDDPEQALQTAVVGALAADNSLLKVALEQHPEQGPAVVITYGQLPLFREQLARFGPQVVPIVAAYQNSFTTADVLQLAREARQAWQALRNALDSLTTLWPLVSPAAGAPKIPTEAADSHEEQTAAENHIEELGRLTPEDRGLIALLNMREEGNAFVGQWEIDKDGEAKRVPSRLVTLAAPEFLFGGLTDLERRIVQNREIDWKTYGLAAVDVAAIGAGVALLRVAKTAVRGVKTTRAATKTATVRSGVLATAELLGLTARFAAPIGLVVLMLWYPGVFTHAMWVFAETFGLPGIVGPLIGWGIVAVPLAFLLSWTLLSVRLLRFVGWLFAGAARACQHLAHRLAAADQV